MLNQTGTIRELRDRLNGTCVSITPEIFQNVTNEFENRLFYCPEVQEERLKDLLK